MSATTVRADTWDRPKPKDFTSPSGNRTFKLTLGGPGLFDIANGVLILRDKDNKEKTVWQRKLVNLPHQAFVSDKTNHVVTIDTYARLGFQHSLVLYGENGEVLGDYRLEDLLTAKEIQDNVKQTVSSRWWASSAKFDFSADGKEFIAALNWGKVIKINLVKPPKSKPEPANAGRGEPSLAEIWSGRALNAQLQEIQTRRQGREIPLEAKVLQHINFTREGSKGSLAMLKKTATLEWPTLMKEETFKTDRKQIETLLHRALEQLEKGEAASVKELTNAAQRLGPAVKSLINEVTPAQYLQARRFILDLDDCVKLLGERDASEYLKFTKQILAKGKTVASLAANMRELKLRFATAVQGDEEAYVLLHRAFAAYLKDEPRK
jgi:hypothetical protein